MRLPGGEVQGTGVIVVLRERKQPDILSGQARSAGLLRTGSEAGAAGAEIAAGIMREEIGRAGRAAVVFASAVSQDPFLAALRTQDIDWTRITAFHMDEYAGMSGGPSGIVPPIPARAIVRSRTGGGVSPTGWRGGGRGGRVRALCGSAAGGGAVPGDHGNRRERAPGVHRSAGLRF